MDSPRVSLGKFIPIRIDYLCTSLAARQASERPERIKEVIKLGMAVLGPAHDLIVSGVVGARVFRNPVVEVAGEFGMGAGREDVADVLLLPEGQDRVGIVLDDRGRLGDQLLCRDSVGGTTAIEVPVGG